VLDSIHPSRPGQARARSTGENLFLLKPARFASQALYPQPLCWTRSTLRAKSAPVLDPLAGISFAEARSLRFAGAFIRSLCVGFDPPFVPSQRPCSIHWRESLLAEARSLRFAGAFIRSFCVGLDPPFVASRRPCSIHCRVWLRFARLLFLCFLLHSRLGMGYRFQELLINFHSQPRPFRDAQPALHQHKGLSDIPVVIPVRS
jgi:hypothetical protein